MRAAFILLAVAVVVASVGAYSSTDYHEYIRKRNLVNASIRDKADCKNQFHTPKWEKHCEDNDQNIIDTWNAKIKKEFSPESIEMFHRMELYEKAINKMRWQKRDDCVKKIIEITLAMKKPKEDYAIKALGQVKAMGEKDLKTWHNWAFFQWHMPGGVPQGNTVFTWCDLYHKE